MTVTAKKEWIGEPGYSNCLLVVMARVPIQSVDLFSNRPLPDLDALIADKPATAAWIRAQEFSYSTLNPLMVIKILSQMGNIIDLLWWYRLPVHDVEEDDGPVIKRIFNLRLSKEEDIFRLQIRLDSFQKIVKS